MNTEIAPGITQDKARKFLGYMIIAKRPCGRVSAVSWDDDHWGRRKRKNFIAEMIDRGDTVERIPRYEGDPPPDWICRPGCNDCRDQGGAPV